jgi:RecA-family ATPase
MMLSLAFETAKAGFKVTPLRPGTKKPLLPEWQKRPFDLLDVTETWRFDDSHGVGIVTGEGFFVLDVDVKNGQPGAESLARMVAAHGPLPATRLARTPSGGWHYYFATPPGRTVSNANKALQARFGDGLDVRGVGGQVVAPGNVYDGKPYTLECDAPIAMAPDWLLDWLSAAPVKRDDAATVVAEPDNPADVASARAWLEKQPDVIEGGRDNAAYRAACQFLNFGALETCRELLEEWSDKKCHPALTDDDLDRIAGSAKRNMQGPIGRDSFEAVTSCFGTVELAPSAGTDTAAKRTRTPFANRVTPLNLTDERIATLPPRQWIAERRLMRGKVTSLVAPGATGKSLLTLQWAAALALGDGRWTALDVREQCSVLVINNEDETEEMERRLVGASLKFSLPFEKINGRLHLHGSERESFTAVRRDDRKLTDAPDLSEAADYIRRHEIGVVIVDPLVETHEANENDNSEMAKVLAAYKRLAADTGAAILLVHHTRKPPQASGEAFAGNMDAGRGASAVVNAVRVGVTLFGVDAELAKRLGIPERERDQYVRLDYAKANLFLASKDAQIFRKASVKLPNGESVGVLEPVSIGPKAELIELMRLAFAAIRDREASGDPLPTATKGDKGAAYVIAEANGLDKKQVQAAIDELAKFNAIEVSERPDARNRKTNVWVTISGEERIWG